MKTVPAIGPTDHSDWVGIHRLSNKKTYTERADMLLSEIVNKFVISAILAAMISSANKKKII